ncbi:MAG: radical SAM protein [Myxococcales bacterium]|nr:radical SAM protein [Myxococcales bacterium]
MTRTRPYRYYDTCLSLCPECLRKVEGKILFRDQGVWMHKRCPQHGQFKVLMADDEAYYRMAREVFVKASEMPERFNTPVDYGCPYDCGICSDHEQHGCLCIVELTDKCNLTCPICYAGSGTHRTTQRSLATIEGMLDAIVRNEGEPDVVQLSGGEPTLHPEFFAILDAAFARPIKHIMVNTNGLRLVTDRAFAERLATYRPRFELYLQFDSFERDALMELRGADLRRSRLQAVEICNELDISCTLVCTVKKGLNDREIGKIVDWALTQPSVRGVTFQPIQQAGRTDNYDPGSDRLTLTEVRRQILEQTTVFAPEDVMPVPCHPDAIAMAYALKTRDGALPLTGMIPKEVLIEAARNTITYETEPAVQNALFDMLSTAHGPESGTESLRQLLCCLPKVDAPDGFGYRDLFRVIIMSFADAWDLDVRSVKKSCVHIVQPDGRLIPFETYNLLYRDELETQYLSPIRAEIKAGRRNER